jgi:hypothetical protein
MNAGGAHRLISQILMTEFFFWNYQPQPNIRSNFKEAPPPRVCIRSSPTNFFSPDFVHALANWAGGSCPRPV